MANAAGTVQGIQILKGSWEGADASNSGATSVRKVALITASFPAYTGSTDTVVWTGVDTAIQNASRNGRTATLRWASSAGPGSDTAGQAVYTSPTITVSGGTLTCDLCGVTAELTAATASSGVQVLVGYDEV